MQWPLSCLLSPLFCLFLLLRNLHFSSFLKLSTCPLCHLFCDSYGAEEEGECPGRRYKTSFETDIFSCMVVNRLLSHRSKVIAI